MGSFTFDTRATTSQITNTINHYDGSGSLDNEEFGSTICALTTQVDDNSINFDSQHDTDTPISIIDNVSDGSNISRVIATSGTNDALDDMNITTIIDTDGSELLTSNIERHYNVCTPEHGEPTELTNNNSTTRHKSHSTAGENNNNDDGDPIVIPLLQSMPDLSITLIGNTTDGHDNYISKRLCFELAEYISFINVRLICNPIDTGIDMNTTILISTHAHDSHRDISLTSAEIRHDNICSSFCMLAWYNSYDITCVDSICHYLGSIGTSAVMVYDQQFTRTTCEHVHFGSMETTANATPNIMPIITARTLQDTNYRGQSGMRCEDIINIHDTNTSIDKDYLGIYINERNITDTIRFGIILDVYGTSSHGSTRKFKCTDDTSNVYYVVNVSARPNGHNYYSPDNASIINTVSVMTRITHVYYVTQYNTHEHADIVNNRWHHTSDLAIMILYNRNNNVCGAYIDCNGNEHTNSIMGSMYHDNNGTSIADLIATTTADLSMLVDAHAHSIEEHQSELRNNISVNSSDNLGLQFDSSIVHHNMNGNISDTYNDERDNDCDDIDTWYTSNAGRSWHDIDIEPSSACYLIEAGTTGNATARVIRTYYFLIHCIWLTSWLNNTTRRGVSHRGIYGVGWYPYLFTTRLFVGINVRGNK